MVEKGLMQSTKVKFTVTYDVEIEASNPEELEIYTNIIRRYLPPSRMPDSARSYVNSKVITPLLKGSEESQIEDALYEANSNIRLAAQILGITRATLYAKMKKYGLAVQKELTSGNSTTD